MSSRLIKDNYISFLLGITGVVGIHAKLSQGHRTWERKASKPSGGDQWRGPGGVLSLRKQESCFRPVFLGHLSCQDWRQQGWSKRMPRAGTPGRLSVRPAWRGLAGALCVGLSAFQLTQDHPFPRATGLMAPHVHLHHTFDQTNVLGPPLGLSQTLTLVCTHSSSPT